MRKLKFNEAIRESTTILMKKDKNVIVVGLGVSDPKGILEQLQIYISYMDLKEFLKFLYLRMQLPE